MGSEVNLIIFTDLDGTLLDQETYRFDSAQDALWEVKRRGIPLVLCTSKTRAEVERYRRALDNDHPFIVENGGGTFIPKDYFVFPYSYHREIAGYHVIEVGASYTQLVVALRMAKEVSGVRVVSFSELSVEEVARLTGLPLDEARLAKEREYDEPFFVDGSEEEAARLKGLLRQWGFLCTQGGRFTHLTGRNEKGGAVSTLIGLFHQVAGRVCPVGIGDSQNDLSMLQAVELPVLVQRPDGTYDPSVKVPNLVCAKGIGPQGWQKTVLDLLVRRG